MSYISIKGAKKTYAPGKGQEELKVLDGFDLSVGKDQFVSLFGPNGCGKSTILNIISGLTMIEGGIVLIGGRQPGEAKTSFVFQNFQETLLPWRTCLGNIAFPLEITGTPYHKARITARNFVSSLGIDLPLKKFPYQLSGGQKQLLVLCRALVFEPELLLMDEPFSALDYDRRTQMEDQLLKLIDGKRVSTVFVSHEVDEAVFLADRVLVLSKTPTKIVADIPVGIPRPRDLSVLKTKEFSIAREAVLSAFRRGNGT